jgi:DNA-directed RNA polymerase specialized sigma24 family protein
VPVKTAEQGADYVSAPRDYAALFEQYYQYVVALVRRLGIDDSRKEDVASEILLRFLERDFLNKFDPTLVFHYDGEDRPAKFKSFLTKFVMVYVRGHWDRQHRLNTRELLMCDRPVGKDDNTVAWVEVFGGNDPAAEDDVIDILDEQDLVDEMRAYILRVPRRSRYDSCDLVALFDEVIRHIRETGTWNVVELREHFGVSATAMHSWMWWLRANLADALGRPVPPKRPRTKRTPAKDCR